MDICNDCKLKEFINNSIEKLRQLREKAIGEDDDCEYCETLALLHEILDDFDEVDKCGAEEE